MNDILNLQYYGPLEGMGFKIIWLSEFLVKAGMVPTSNSEGIQRETRRA